MEELAYLGKPFNPLTPLASGPNFVTYLDTPMSGINVNTKAAVDIRFVDIYVDKELSRHVDKDFRMSTKIKKKNKKTVKNKEKHED